MDSKETKSGEELIKKVMEAENTEALLGILKEHGIEATEEELTKQDENELSDENLEEVAGGLNLSSLQTFGLYPKRNMSLRERIRALQKLGAKEDLRKLPGGELLIKLMKL
ncbi:MAG: Nif11-like leader peptide family RiPP precursor [Clostridia bacterium]|nr:Nif11-like leader peptide family RiPP precursor [Clostridia bacterium]